MKENGKVVEVITATISADGKTLLASGGANGQKNIGGIFRSDDLDHTNWAQTRTADTACVQFHPTDSLRAVAGGG